MIRISGGNYCDMREKLVEGTVEFICLGNNRVVLCQQEIAVLIA